MSLFRSHCTPPAPCLVAIAAVSLLGACTAPSQNSCTDERDCFEGEICVQNICARTLTEPDAGDEQPDADAHTPDTSGTPDTGDDTDTSDPDPVDSGNDSGTEIPDVDNDDDADTSPCNPNPCTEPGRTVCTVEGQDAVCSCDEGHVESLDVCVPFACESPGPGPVVAFSGAQASRQDVEASVVWADDAYLIVWSDDRASSNQSPRIYAARFDREGNPLGQELQLTSTPGGSHISTTSLVKANDGYGLIWRDGRGGPDRNDAYFQRLDNAGQPVGSPLALTDGIWADRIALTWTGSHFIALWTHLSDAESAVKLAKITSDGELDGPPVNIATDTPSGWATLAWSGSSLGVVWRQNIDPLGYSPRTFFQRFDANINPLDPAPIQVADGRLHSPTLLATDEHFAITASDNFYHATKLFQATYDANGQPVRETEEISFVGHEVHGLNALWSGQDYLFFWKHVHTIRAQRFSELGVEYDASVELMNNGYFPWYPASAWDGERALVVWNVGIGQDNDGDPDYYRFVMRTYCPE
ncbi:hypothetical protein DV096_00745 [Bradymonadaceae bacterium TMQ3]|uniref:EGF-like domain-containing protein n=1 Tax=Lujinxingia sediminis TaxID=2480984 RepID=A0ABY0CY66_9DELT|nr:hypothetical protein [Lujinxingia sediminis]RDV39133.1 hypothetical protein DV096_00745 [Bradymonadaceae bacterium TMQ3]RVU48822.1 hypothetical protein EA187_05180 [Lujinxingia sediminis]TXC78115.1 hypothetical protein FRC91_05145 [Bradymonadales bacterium TMQ1]